MAFSKLEEEGGEGGGRGWRQGMEGLKELFLMGTGTGRSGGQGGG